MFYEEELDVPLVLFDEVLDHVLRIDRIFRQPQGHVLLIGVSGAGKTTLSRFVAWMNGLSVFQVKVHNKYTAEDFDEDLRGVLRRSGCRVSVWHCLFQNILIISTSLSVAERNRLSDSAVNWLTIACTYIQI